MPIKSTKETIYTENQERRQKADRLRTSMKKLQYYIYFNYKNNYIQKEGTSTINIQADLNLYSNT